MSQRIEPEKDPLERLLDIVDAEFDRLARKLYNDWVDLDEANYMVGSHMCKARDMGVFEDLFEHFESLEEYEICADLQEMYWRILGVW
jgi:hypothetical protein